MNGQLQVPATLVLKKGHQITFEQKSGWASETVWIIWRRETFLAPVGDQPEADWTLQLLELLYVINMLRRFSVCFGVALSLTLHLSCRHTSLILWFANVLNYVCFVLSRTWTFLEASLINTPNTHANSTLVSSISDIYDTGLSVLNIHPHRSNIYRHFISILIELPLESSL